MNKKERLWQIASYNLVLYSEGVHQHTVIRDMWDGILNRIADIKEFNGDWDKTLNAIEKAESFSEKNDVPMVRFWMDQFYYQVLRAKTREIKHDMVVDLHKYRLSKRNALVRASYDFVRNATDLSRKIYVRY